MKTSAILLAAGAAVTAFTTSGATKHGSVPAANVASAAASAPRAPAANPDPFAEDREAIKAVMKAFQESIRTHDLARMRSLFWNENIVWVGAGHPESYRFYARQVPTMKQVEQAGAYQFLGDSAFARVPMEERFFDPVIDTDGQVALASFNYVFVFNGVASNWGREYWQLAKVGTTWKILHLLYSYQATEVKPVPASHR